MFWHKKPKPIVLCEQLAAVLPPGMTIPEPIRLLYSWIEQTNRFTDGDEGQRFGTLNPTPHSGDEPGTYVLFHARWKDTLRYWFGHDHPEVMNRLCPFANTGSDGSMGAFWLDDDGVQRIVQMGSGSGSISVCVLAEQPIDFLRLLAIGYDEICWCDDWPMTPRLAAANNDEPFRGINHEYNDWLTRTLRVSIPERATDIIRNPSKMGDADPVDRFARWVNSISA